MRDKSHCLDANYFKASNGTVPMQGSQSSDRMMVAEPVCLRYERSDEAKACRKDYESHNITHGYREMTELHPREDGKTNTLSTVLKDNPICEPVCVAERVPDYSSDKSRPLSASYCHKGDGEGSLKSDAFPDNPNKQVFDYVAEPIQVGAMPRPNGELSTSQGFRVYSEDGKTVAIKGNAGGSGGKTGLYAVPVECENEPISIDEAKSFKDCESYLQYDINGKGNASQGQRIRYPEAKSATITAGGTTSKIKIFDRVPDAITYELSEEYFKGGKDTSLVGMTTDGEGKYRNGNQPSQQYRIYSCDDKAQVLNTFANENYIVPSMDVKEATAKGYTEIDCGDCVDLQHINSKNRRGRNMKNKTNALQTSNEFYQYVGYVIEFADGKPIKAIGKDGKETTIYEVRDGKITIKGKQYPIKLVDGYYIIRKLTVTECMRLQTVPEWYEFPVSNSQAYKLLGNGWTCDVITHLILSALNGVEADTQTTLGV